MPPAIATLVFLLGIVALFALERDPEVRTSKALWLPVLWLLINGSRPISQWTQLGPAIDSADALLDGSPLDAFVFAALMLAGLAVMLTRGRQVLRVLRSNGPLVVFFMYCAVSVVWSDFPFVAFKRWTKAVGDVAMILIVVTDPNVGNAIKRLLARTGFVLLPASILLIRYYPDLGRGYDRWEGTMRIVGVTTNKNMLGMTCLVLGLGALWRLLNVYRAKKSPFRRNQLVAQSILLALAVWLLSIANSMTSFSCFALAAILIIVTSIPAIARRRAVIHTLVVAILLIAFSPLFLAFGSGLVGMLGRDTTLTGRTVIWNLVLGLAGNPFFGTGFESFWLGDRFARLANIFFYPLNEAHNGYIEVYLNLGWVGLTVLAAIVVTGYRNVLRCFRQGQDVAPLRLAYLVTALAYSVTEAGFRMMSMVWIVFLFAITRTAEAQLPQAQSGTTWQEEPVSATTNFTSETAGELTRF